jgi:hypothetical protein
VGTAPPSDPEAAGSVASSPDPATVPGAGKPPGPTDSGDAAGDGGGVGDSAGAAAAQAQGLVESRPEVLVAGAFVGGLVAAKVLAALGGRR